MILIAFAAAVSLTIHIPLPPTTTLASSGPHRSPINDDMLRNTASLKHPSLLVKNDKTMVLPKSQSYQPSSSEGCLSQHPRVKPRPARSLKYWHLKAKLTALVPANPV